VQAISTFLAGWAKQLGFAGLPVIIGNGVDIANFSNKHHEKNHNGTILVTASRLVHKNAIDDVIRSLAFLPESIKFRIYGIGPEEFKLRQLAEELGVSSRVEWKGYVNHKELPSALAECDVFIRPSRSEGMGNSFIEAMAAGLPVIATQEGGIADFLFDAKRNPDKETTGWAVDKDSPEQIAEAVKYILNNPEQVTRVTATAKKLVRDNYDWNSIAEKMKILLNRLFVSH
jgi:glycosyltransferase involved in cell wall biosynthesis